jgi:CDP-glucose 4,6-dehydratase
VDAGFWRGKRVLLTGHTGFKGAWLALWLEHWGAELTGFALAPPTQPSLFAGASVSDGMRSTLGDIRDPEALRAAFDAARPEVVVHMAAQTLVQYGYRNPVETYSTNVLGTVNVLEAARHCDSLRVVVSVTSDKSYRNRSWEWGYRETDELGGHDPYSNSKACAELVTAAYRDSYLAGRGVGVATARAGNVIGGGDWADDRLVPDLMRGFLGGHAVKIRCPDATRPWQHVLEPLGGYLLLAQRLWEAPERYAEAWNFGPRDEDCRPVRWVADRLCGLWGPGGGWELDAQTFPPEATFLKVDCSKAAARLAWTPRMGLEEGLDWCAEWYRRSERGEDQRRLCLEQIERFVQRGRGG